MGSRPFRILGVWSRIAVAYNRPTTSVGPRPHPCLARTFSIADNRCGRSTRLAHALAGRTYEECPAACTALASQDFSPSRLLHYLHVGYSHHLGPGSPTPRPIAVVLERGERNAFDFPPPYDERVASYVAESRGWLSREGIECLEMLLGEGDEGAVVTAMAEVPQEDAGILVGLAGLLSEAYAARVDEQ
jgi:hypothetical protein